MPWQAASCDKIAGRDGVRITLLLQGAQAPAPHLCVLTHQPTGHVPTAGSLGWAFLAVPALSPTILCSRMHAGASEASSTIGSVVEDVETVVGASSGAVFALDMSIASACVLGCKKCCACAGESVYQNTL